MQYSSDHSKNNLDGQPSQHHWHTYRQLELIPNSVPQPNTGSFAFGLDFLWRGLLNLLAEELVDEQRVEYLDRCWTLDETTVGQQTPTVMLQRLWSLMES